MELLLELATDPRSTEPVTVRLLALNDSYEPTALDRRLLVGPNPVPDRPAGPPFPISVEPALPLEEENLVMLSPWCFYGRQRTFDRLPPGRVSFYGYLLRKASDLLLPERPKEPEALLVAAAPLAITVDPRHHG